MTARGGARRLGRVEGRPRVRYWLFPLLVALLVLGHACDLPAYAELIVSHDIATDKEAPAAHEHGDDEALTCDGAGVVPSSGFAGVSPVLIVTGVLPQVTSTPLAGPLVPTRPTRSSTDPPLFLLFSSFLI